MSNGNDYGDDSGNSDRFCNGNGNSDGNRNEDDGGGGCAQ